jgi:hypothetical protein
MRGRCLWRGVPELFCLKPAAHARLNLILRNRCTAVLRWLQQGLCQRQLRPEVMITYKQYHIERFEHGPKRWVARITRTDGQNIRTILPATEPLPRYEADNVCRGSRGACQGRHRLRRRGVVRRRGLPTFIRELAGGFIRLRSRLFTRKLLWLGWLISLMALGLGGRARVHAMTFA